MAPECDLPHNIQFGDENLLHTKVLDVRPAFSSLFPEAPECNNALILVPTDLDGVGLQNGMNWQSIVLGGSKFRQ